ncbi:DUF488 domain-containing protein [Gandjariella thermophila]|uniref:DNA repair protein n=1 Tax=Gandjariella thermophila TaxID=1931992 RepID=A0A4D4JC60_9PSEU|nr:DUF488 domain-containing protein [Gandjariella thermophila]GDY32248.1 hypothetical protein GTS_38810 [Gandjariella thermophila]
MVTPLLTFGHGTATAERIVELLRGAGVEQLVDVRTAPGSRRNPHVARTAISEWLPEHGIGYRWEKRLGGFRRARPDAPDTALRNRAFAGYAGHMRSPEFLAAVDDLLAEARLRRTAVMCAESVWWRCHRRMIADFVVLARETPVLHLGHDGSLARHAPTDAARRRPDGLLVYDQGQDALFRE